MNTNLDQGDVLRDASAGPSIQKMMVEESGEQSFPNTCTSEINQVKKIINFLFQFVTSFLSNNKHYYRNCINYTSEGMIIDE